MDNTHNLPRPEESELIERARKRIIPTVSITEAAKRVGLSRNRYSDLEKGFRWLAAGEVIENVAPAETLARIASGLDISPKELIAVGRADAAKIRKAEIEFLEANQKIYDDITDIPTSDLLEEIRRRIDGDAPASVVPLVARTVDRRDSSTFEQ